MGNFNSKEAFNPKSKYEHNISVKVSVVICTYRGANSLRRAILSVLNQTYKNIELIVVDDNGSGSPNQIRTFNVVKEFRDVIYCSHKTNLNGAAARNTGISLSSGNYICFLDDDDIMLPTRIEKSVLCLQNTDEFDAVYVDVLYANEELLPYRVVRVRDEGNCYKNILPNESFIGTGSNLFLRRSVFEKLNGFDTAFLRHQDLEFMLRFYRYFKTTFVPELLLIKSMNGTDNIPNYKRMIAVKKLYTEKFNSEIESLSPQDKEEFFKTTKHDILRSKINDKNLSLSSEDIQDMSLKDKIIRVIVILNLQKPARAIKHIIQGLRTCFSLSKQERNYLRGLRKEYNKHN